jgi:antitoxin ParD1/3/4
MPITLKQEQEKFVLDKLQQGKYENIDELFAIAFLTIFPTFPNIR